MAKTKTNLVIVESPAKAKTIGKYLGSDYRVTASMGHLRDLPKSVLGVDIEHGFAPDYRPVKGREDTIDELKKEAKRSASVYLATDPDREGEAISWHLKELLGIPDGAVCRVTFNEITRNVVQESIRNPRAIDMNLVDAQQARRVLDRIVGYKLSPLLWKKIRRGLSAGRVQSVAARMVVDRENEIRGFVPEEYWHLDAVLETADGGSFTARYFGTGGKKRELRSEQDVLDARAAVENAPFSVGDVKTKENRRTPPPPFITSTLQQEASRRLGMTPKRTMAVAQQLYEGIDIPGEGTVGLITYMRTDSLRLSDVALSDAAKFIREKYGNELYAGKPRRYRAKSGAQDAHEAIRPSSVFLTPESIRGALNSDQYRLYRLVWSRFVACQMAAAVYEGITVDAEAAGHVFRASHSVLRFPGYTAVYEESRDDDGEEKEPPLPDLTVGQPLTLRDLKQEQKFTQPPARYTEATLIREMEETGVGRPSTYAPTISTILDREYVVKEGRFLRPTPLGEVVTGLMTERFSDIVDLKFTARMEDALDDVEKGEKVWTDVLTEFYGGFAEELKRAEDALEGERIKVPDEVSDEVCDICGRQLVVKTGRFGRFLACPGYPECSFTKPLVVEMPGKCPKCGSRLLKRTSKKGYPYYACEHLSRTCDFLTWDVPVKDNCPVCGKTMFKKSGRGYKRPFCINEECANFVPEEKRGGYPRRGAAAKKDAEKKNAEKKAPAKKASGRKAGTAGRAKKSGDSNDG
ncbi:MAG: type I DNA topoisomerase [Oscillospiraceae bacterium]|nr:type I DNA topoisomerase [Oscillospiraceae bacterium]